MATLDRRRKSNFRDVRCCDPAAEVHNAEDDEDVTSNGGIAIYLWLAQRGKRLLVARACNKTSTIKTKRSRKKKNPPETQIAFVSRWLERWGKRLSSDLSHKL